MRSQGTVTEAGGGREESGYKAIDIYCCWAVSQGWERMLGLL